MEKAVKHIICLMDRKSKQKGNHVLEIYLLARALNELSNARALMPSKWFTQ